jgi:LysM repeat protein
MAARSPARFLAPLALLAFVVALLLIVSHSSSDSGSSGEGRTSEEQPANSPAVKGDASSNAKPKGPRRYTVKPGDTPSSIAEKTGVPLSQIQELNPDLDPQTLSPGQRIRLRR